jgi:lipopolysaccharide/colanic/teichoic acid biosynthesis glycosyltransferase
LKRYVDVAIASVAILILLPVFAVVSLCIKLSDGGPVFFGHTRIGLRRRPFVCWKFRSMVCCGDAVFEAFCKANPAAAEEWQANQKCRNDPRVTAIGRFLRATSLDELPQLFNVLNGTMSLVGPRPIVASEAAHYGAYFDLYTCCRPGITGLWQVSGRSNTTYPERVALDVRYLTRWSMWADLLIALKTVKVVLTQSGSC